MVRGFGALLSSGICSIALVAVHVQAATSGSEAGVRQARCPLALVQLNASPGLISVSNSASSTTSTTSKGEVQKIKDHLKNVTSKAVNATERISTAAGGVLANAWNATEDAASEAASWVSNAASGVGHALGAVAHAVSNKSGQVVSSIEDTMGGTANSSNSSSNSSNNFSKSSHDSSNSSNDSEGIVGHVVDAVADDVDGAAQAVAEVVGSKHNGSKHNSSAKSIYGCVTQDTENAQALSSYVSLAGSPCFFGVDERDEGSHCIDQAGEYGPNGWCWTGEDLESWGKCSSGCPLSGADEELEKRLQRIEKKLDKVESEIHSH